MKALIIGVLLIVLPFGLLAQQDTLHQDHKNYVDLGLGLGKGNHGYWYGTAQLLLQRKNNYIGLGTSHISAPEFIFGDEPTPFTKDVSLTVGKSLTFNGYINIQFGAGLAYVQDVSRGKLLYNTCKGMFCIVGHDVYESVKRQAIGFPIEIKTNFYLDRTAAITFGLRANLNQIHTYSGFYVGVMVGRLRDRISKRAKVFN